MGDAVAAQIGGAAGDFLADLDHVVDMTLGIGAARDGQAYQFQGGGGFAAIGVAAEHDRADLAAAHATDCVQGHGQGLTGVVQGWNMRQQGLGIQVHRVATAGLHHRDAGCGQGFAQVGGGADAIAQVVVINDFLQPLRQGFQIASGEAAVGGKTLGQDQEIAALLGQGVIVERQPAADIAHRVFLGAHGHAIGQAGHFAHDVSDIALALSGFAFADEPGVFGKAAGVQEQGHAVAAADRMGFVQIGQAHRLATAGIVGDGDEHHRHVPGMLTEKGIQRSHVHIALERVQTGRVTTFGDHQIHGFGTAVFDIGAGGVEMSVAGDQLALAAQHGEDDFFRGAALVGRDHVLEGEQRLHRALEDLEGWAAGIGFVTMLDRGPLIATHGTGARVGEQVDQHIVGVQVEQVVAGSLECRQALDLGGHADRGNGLDAEGFDDGAKGHGDLQIKMTVQARSIPMMQTADGVLSNRAWTGHGFGSMQGTPEWV